MQSSVWFGDLGHKLGFRAVMGSSAAKFLSAFQALLM